jgi:hypothetical protein
MSQHYMSQHVHIAEQIAMFETVKVACSKTTSNLCFKLSCRFPNVDVMVVISMVYLQY